MEDERRIVRSVFNDGRRKIGLRLTESEEPVYVEDCIQFLALDIVESYQNIKEGEKSREETNIDLQMEVLNSLSNALKSLGTVLYH